MRYVVAAALVAALAFLLASCGGSKEHTLKGTFEIRGNGTVMEFVSSPTAGEPDSCLTRGGYVDIKEGTQVKVSDEAGKTIGIGELGKAKWTPPIPGAFGCTFPFEVKGLPQVEFYAIEVSHRGVLEYSRGDLEAKDWFIELTLGN